MPQAGRPAPMATPTANSTLRPLATKVPKPLPGSTATPTPAPTASFNGTSGTITASESNTFNIGSGKLEWSISIGQGGYFYTGTNPDYSNPVQVAGVTSSSDCNSSYKGYTGLSDINDLSDASSLTYSIAPTPNNSQGAVYIASKSETSCDNEGMLVFTQAGRYGVLDFVNVSGDSMTIDWWLGAPGVSDFSQAPD